MLFLAVLGPGIITANVDNDTGGILTYSQAGAQYGLLLLWTILPVTLALIVVQEMSARMGVVTGKGLSDLIREEFGLRLTFILMVMLVIVNYTNVVTEFIGIAGSMQLFHVSKFISVPFCAGLVWYMVVRGTYKSTEKYFWLPRSFISPTFLPAFSRSQVGTQHCWPQFSFLKNRSGATRFTCTRPSAWSAPPLPRGCSFICNPRSSKRGSASRITRLRAST